MGTAVKIREAIASIAHVPVTQIADAARITEDLGIRSVQRVELAALLEVELGRSIDDATVNRAKTVSELLRALGAN